MIESREVSFAISREESWVRPYKRNEHQDHESAYCGASSKIRENEWCGAVVSAYV